MANCDQYCFVEYMQPQVQQTKRSFANPTVRVPKINHDAFLKMPWPREQHVPSCPILTPSSDTLPSYAISEPCAILYTRRPTNHRNFRCTTLNASQLRTVQYNITDSSCSIVIAA